jgi:hypothetical protein
LQQPSPTAKQLHFSLTLSAPNVTPVTVACGTIVAEMPGIIEIIVLSRVE